MTGRPLPSAPVDGYRLVFTDGFDGEELDPERWLPAHLPQWSSRAQAAARYRLDGSRLVLRIDADQPPWCPELDGTTRVSSLQTGVYAGGMGSPVGQHRFHADAVVREAQAPARLFTPHHGYVEARLAALADPSAMVAFWMIGYEDAPEHCGEICVAEIFGRDVERDRVRVGMGVHPFADPALTDDFAQVPLDLDATVPHTYGAEWTPAGVDFFVDGERVRSTPQSPGYPMQLMLGIYEFRDRDDTRYPKELVVDHVRGFRRTGVTT